MTCFNSKLTFPCPLFLEYYQGRYEFYLQELSQCRVMLNFRDGWDTMCYWEVPAVGAFMMTQKPGIKIPDDFVDGRDVVYCSDDLSDLTDLCDYYLKNESKREAIALSGKQHLLQHHTDVARARLLLEKISGLV